MSLPDPNAPNSVPPPGAPVQPPPVGAAPAPSPGGGEGNVRRLLTLGAGAVCLVLAAVLLLSLRGGDSPTGGPLSPVAEAAERTAQSTGAQVVGTGEVTASGVSMTMGFSGAFSADGERATMTYEVRSSTLPAAAAQMGPMEMIVDEGVVYVSSPAFAPVLGGKNWMKMDFSEFAPDASASSLDAQLLLNQLNATGPNPQVVGNERVRGTKTKRYTATIDPQLQAEQLRELGEDEAAELVEQQATSTTVDVWIDNDGLVRRMAMAVPFDAVGGSGARMQMTMDFFDFGTEPTIALPPEDQVMDASELDLEGVEGLSLGS